MINYIKHFLDSQWFWYSVIAAAFLNLMMTFYFINQPKPDNTSIILDQMNKDLDDIILTLDKLDDTIKRMDNIIKNSQEVKQR